MLNGRIRALVLLLTDAMTFVACLALAVFGYWVLGFGYYMHGFRFYLSLWPAVFAFLGVNVALKLYHGNILYPAAPVSPVEELRRLFWSSALTHIGILAALALTRQTTEGYSRAAILISGVLLALLAQPMRDLVRMILYRLGIGQIPVFLAAGGTAAKQVSESIVGDAYVGFRLVRVFEEDFREIVPAARAAGVKVLLACQDARVFRCQMEDFTGWFAFIEYLPTADVFPVSGARPIVIGGVGGLEMVNQRRMRVLRWEKSVLDRLLSLFALLVVTPLFAVIPLLIKLTSRGPVFYRAQRIGKSGRPIRVWKFRSMYADADRCLTELLDANPGLKAEYEANFKLFHDPRVTPFGRFLRKTSLDEIPQLFNVFSGEMALIGPRPIVEKEIPYYGRDYSVFSSVKPGITGLWQVSGRSDTDYARRVALDVHYVLNWSPWLDLWILFRTFGAVLFMRGAR